MGKFIIVGQGVAGTLLAFELERRGIDFELRDNNQNHSSSVAAGIMNPVVFRRLTKTWNLDECWDLAIGTYKSLEEKLGERFLYVRPMRRLFASEQEFGFWEEKTQKPDFQKYIAQFPPDDKCPHYALNTYGNGLVRKVYNIDVQKFLNTARSYFTSNGKLSTQDVDYAEILAETEDCSYCGAIFCQGYKNFENPFFKKLPVQNTKGQLITIKSGELSEHELLNRKCFVLPVGNQLFRVGATYEWENTSLNTTEAARIQILEKLKSLTNATFDVVEQHAGIRPTTPDRRPILGRHPEYDKLFILNGLGTKGYLLAPWCVQHLCKHIFEGSPISDEVNLQRFKVI
jgi:glycine/D-amino acid oxidase-like deaminating enzyme